MKLSKRLGWVVLLFASSMAQADMLAGLKAYEQKKYEEAQQHFAELLPLGNELAAYNLGAMAYQGEGQPQDLTKALAYFMLAADLEYKPAVSLLSTLVEQATETQLEQSTQQFEKLKQHVLITPADLDKSRKVDSPEPLKRKHPEYPLKAAQKRQFGYVQLRFLVNEEGNVTAIDTLDSYPVNVFETSAIKAVKRWRYAPSEQKHIMKLRLSYSIGEGIKLPVVEDVVNELKLWDYAVAGVPQYQLALGTLWSLVGLQSGNLFTYDSKLPLAAKPDFSIFAHRSPVTADFSDFSDFWGDATVRVSEDGLITEQIKANFEDKSKVTNLVGLKLKGNIESDVYALSRLSTFSSKKTVVRAVVKAPDSMSDMFWWEQAAKNGSVEAQRVMAAHESQWEHYLLHKEDAEVMAWAGTRFILEGQREYGLQLIEQAIAKNYQPAKEMKKQFM
ncbi:TonB family protein [Rheinheimera pacifica]|uniref:TonB family protein n=1 Tax=Rheinheimera pacifica TaxID=173990 RepID=UPI0028654A20|nr:TonB family protein [Rheinheimera pacifica]MDR6984914.1 TonB family protein [Rheinheimera pacifica]